MVSGDHQPVIPFKSVDKSCGGRLYWQIVSTCAINGIISGITVTEMESETKQMYDESGVNT